MPGTVSLVFGILDFADLLVWGAIIAGHGCLRFRRGRWRLQIGSAKIIAWSKPVWRPRCCNEAGREEEEK